jgi:hypothetical protein
VREPIRWRRAAVQAVNSKAPPGFIRVVCLGEQLWKGYFHKLGFLLRPQVAGHGCKPLCVFVVPV